MSYPRLFLMHASMETFLVPTAGTQHALSVDIRQHCRGDITDGVSFELGCDDCWVVPLDSLREIVRLADQWRQRIAELNEAEGKP